MKKGPVCFIADRSFVLFVADNIRPQGAIAIPMARIKHGEKRIIRIIAF